MVRIAALLALLLASSATLVAQDVPPIDVKPSPSTPPEAVSPEERAIEEAIEGVKAELAELEATWNAEAEELNRRIRERTAEVRRLADDEIELRRTHDQLGEDLFTADERRVEAEAEKGRREIGFEALASELRSQAFDLRERYQVSLLVVEDPELLTALEGIIEQEGEVETHLRDLLATYATVLDGADSAVTFPTDLRLTASGGEIREGNVLRLGLLGGYYSSGDEAGFVLSPTEVGEKPEGRSVGVSDAQQASIARVVADPTNGGTLPMDATGGAGIASLDLGDSFLEWFEKGGVFMWPIAIVAALALLMVIERAIALTIRTRGIDRHIAAVLELIENGRSEEALQYTSRVGGPAGRVLEAALVHSDRDRSVMEDAVQEAILHTQPLFTARLSFIALCAAVAPLMGLLGTVTGMILTFNRVTVFGTSDPRFMAGGISVALITTQGGLYLAIPCLLARGVLGAFADGAMGKLETGAMSVVLAILKSRGEEELEEEDSTDGPEIAHDEPAPRVETTEDAVSPIFASDEDEEDAELDLDADLDLESSSRESRVRG